MNIENFPELTGTQTTQNQSPGQDFVTALKKSKQQVDNKEKVLPGWVKISFHPYKGYIYEYGKTTFNQTEISLNDDANSSIEIMKERWNQYKDNYIELCGEEEYSRYYPQYISIDYEVEVDDETVGY